MTKGVIDVINALSLLAQRVHEVPRAEALLQTFFLDAWMHQAVQWDASDEAVRIDIDAFRAFASGKAGRKVLAALDALLDPDRFPELQSILNCDAEHLASLRRCVVEIRESEPAVTEGGAASESGSNAGPEATAATIHETMEDDDDDEDEEDDSDSDDSDDTVIDACASERCRSKRTLANVLHVLHASELRAHHHEQRSALLVQQYNEVVDLVRALLGIKGERRPSQ